MDEDKCACALQLLQKCGFIYALRDECARGLGRVSGNHQNREKDQISCNKRDDSSYSVRF